MQGVEGLFNISDQVVSVFQSRMKAQDITVADTRSRPLELCIDLKSEAAMNLFFPQSRRYGFPCSRQKKIKVRFTVMEQIYKSF